MLTLLMLRDISGERQRKYHILLVPMYTHTHTSTDTNMYAQENTADVGFSLREVILYVTLPSLRSHFFQCECAQATA